MGKLPGGQWIPSAFFISALFMCKKSCDAYCWTMGNSDTTKVTQASLSWLEQHSGLCLWDNVAAGDFKKKRDQIHNDDWWKKGQLK